MDSTLFMQYMLIILISDVAMNLAVAMNVFWLRQEYQAGISNVKNQYDEVKQMNVHIVNLGKVTQNMRDTMLEAMEHQAQAMGEYATVLQNSANGLLNVKLGSQNQTIQKNIEGMDKSIKGIFNVVEMLQNLKYNKGVLPLGR